MRKRKTMRGMLIGLGMLVLILISAPVYAATPLETVRTEVNKVLDALRNKGLKEEAKKETLRLVYREMFDQIELARLSLGNNWNKLTEAQRQEFVELFQQVLEKAYADKILAYTDEKILYDREVPISKNRVGVQTRVVTKSKEIPIIYRVVQKSDG
jgi:phospholipid transport system substrate-binding protein